MFVDVPIGEEEDDEWRCLHVVIWMKGTWSGLVWESELTKNEMGGWSMEYGGDGLLVE